jgi:hypothetical protein
MIKWEGIIHDIFILQTNCNNKTKCTKKKSIKIDDIGVIAR